MTASAPVVRPEGGAGLDPLPRRVVAALRAGIRNGQAIRWIGATGAVIPALALAFILVVLVVKGWPAIRINGMSFFSSKAWSQGNQYALKPVTKNGYQLPPGAAYGALPLIVGTVATSVIALIIAVPVAIGTALAVVERLPKRVAYLVGLFLEVLAGMPSVIIGLFGAVTLGPIVAHDIAPYVARNMPDVPVLSYFRGATGSGYGLLTSGLVLSLMVIPIIAATTRDLFGRCRSCPARARSPSACPTRSARVRSRCRGSARESSGPWCWASAGPWARRWPSPWSAARHSARSPRTCTTR